MIVARDLPKVHSPTTTVAAPVPQPSAPQPKDEDLPFGELVEELVAQHQVGFDWGLRNGFPRARDYPQYERVRRLGELIHAKAGYEGMQEACRILQRRVVTRDGGGQAWLAEAAWEGIDDWRP